MAKNLSEWAGLLPTGSSQIESPGHNLVARGSTNSEVAETL